MMLKFAGAGMVLLACLGYIFSREREFLEHKKQLEEFAMLLSLLQNEMCLLRLPLELALEHAGMHLHNPYRSLCTLTGEELDRRRGSAQEIWRGLLEKRKREFLLDDEEFRLLVETGEVLGMGNAEFKEELFAVYEKRLEGLADSYETSLEGRRRVSRYGTLFAGIFLIILFI